ncbi:ATP-binding cassette domain-containing protein [Neisseriaceae bacterium PsAf]|nr:ATP-binding cassette domain-containing protein [Neisseriaceae bacterium PsAf]
MEEGPELLVQLNELGLQYINRKPISLSLHRGEKIALVGSNGTGKSLLLKTIINPKMAKSRELIVTPSLKYIDQYFSFLDKNLSAYENFVRLVPGLQED